MTESSALSSVVEALVALWLRRTANGCNNTSVGSVYQTMAALVTGTHQFDNPLRVPHVFRALSTFRPSVVKTIFQASGPAVWKAFLDYSVTQEAVAYPLMLSPLVAQQMNPHALCRGWLYGTDTQELMERILTDMGMFVDNNNVVPINPHVPWTMSWLGYFTLSSALFCTEQFDWEQLTDDFVERILNSALQHAVWWSHADNAPNWGWAVVVVRLLAVFVRHGVRNVCHRAACALARHLATAVDADALSEHNWPMSVPIFPYPCDFGRFLWLLTDYDLMNTDALPVLVKSHTGAILNRLRAVKPMHWTSEAAACVVRHGATRTVSTVAWAAWFHPSTPRIAQCAAVNTADAVRPSKPCKWSTMLRIHALIPTLCAPARGGGTLGRLVSNATGVWAVERVLDEWVTQPTPKTQAEATRWASAATSDTVEPFILARMQRYCMSCMTVPLQTLPQSISGSVGMHLMERANALHMPDACYALWFVVHYCDNYFLTQTAAYWMGNLRRRMVSVCATGLGSGLGTSVGPVCPILAGIDGEHGAQPTVSLVPGGAMQVPETAQHGCQRAVPRTEHGCLRRPPNGPHGEQR